MESLDSRRTSYADLHPAIRDSVREILAALKQDDLPFELFEAFRSPARQRHLFAQGRTRPGNKVTWVGPWGSFHQYGLAVDLVLKIKGQWSWDDSGKMARSWARLHEIGHAHGLRPISKEKPHLQWAGGSIEDLLAGRYPPGGDESWADNFEAAIASWSGQGGAPPPPKGIVQRPPLAPGDIEAEAGGSSSRAPIGGFVMAGSADFERAHAFVKEFEGGFVNDPKDPGGATNFGITIGTLSAVRGRQVSVQEVHDLTFGEAKQIFFDLYWSRMSCDRIPGPLALAVYNIGVHCGVKTGGTYLQRALNANGAAVEVDGWIGDETAGAVGQSDLRAVLDETIGLYESRLRGHPNFAHFKNGFMRRVTTLRQEAGGWLNELAVKPQPAPAPTGGIPMNLPTQQQPDLLELLKKFQELATAFRAGNQPASPAPTQPGDLQASLTALIAFLQANGLIDKRILPVPQPQEKPLTPVNGALGDAVGRLLDGKKSAIGIFGALLTQIMPQPVIDALKTALPAALVPGTSGPLLAIFLAMTAWGALGKMEKLAKGVPTNQ